MKIRNIKNEHHHNEKILKEKNSINEMTTVISPMSPYDSKLELDYNRDYLSQFNRKLGLQRRSNSEPPAEEIVNSMLSQMGNMLRGGRAMPLNQFHQHSPEEEEDDILPLMPNNSNSLHLISYHNKNNLNSTLYNNNVNVVLKNNTSPISR